NLRCELRGRAHRGTDDQPGGKPRAFRRRRDLRARRMRHPQPRVVVSIHATAVKQAGNFAGLRLVQQETTVAGDVGRYASARAQRLLCKVYEREEAPLLNGHGRCYGSCITFYSVFLRVSLSYCTRGATDSTTRESGSTCAPR